MNLLKTFEGRISDLFDSAPAGYTAPFSFKRLAKRAAREMEGETFVIDGVDTAPGLYTILVSTADDASMRPLYPQLTNEITSFVEAQAQQKGYVFVAKPLTRFMVDPSLKSGKFAVFAENVDARTLERLREEEKAFLSGSAGLGGAASQSGPISVDVQPVATGRRHHQGDAAVMATPASATPAPRPQAAVVQPVPSQEAPEVEQIPTAAPSEEAQPKHAPSAPRHGHQREEMPLAAPAPQPEAAVHQVPQEAQAPKAVPPQYEAPDLYAPAEQEFAPLEDPEDRSAGLNVIPNSAIDDVVRARAEGGQQFQPISPVPEESASIAPAPIGVPRTQRRNVPLVNPYRARSQQREQPRATITCLLVDHQSGRTYTGSAPSTVIGRERTPGGIVLRDPNVSRQHAELTYDGRSWRIADLNSTNGTLVNDVDIETAVLHDGDLITLGLTNLEFREN